MNRARLASVAVLAVALVMVGVVRGQSAGSTSLEALRGMLEGPRGDYRATLRVTSSGEDFFSVVGLEIEKTSAWGLARFRFTIEGESGSAEACFQCTGDGTRVPCDGEPFPAAPESWVPGTLLPWSELTTGLCGGWTLRAVRGHANEAPAVEILFGGGEGLGRTIAFLDEETDLPVKLVRYDRSGVPVREVAVLETGALGDLKGISRALLRHSTGKVLIETRAFVLHPQTDSDPWPGAGR